MILAFLTVASTSSLVFGDGFRPPVHLPVIPLEKVQPVFPKVPPTKVPPSNYPPPQRHSNHGTPIPVTVPAPTPACPPGQTLVPVACTQNYPNPSCYSECQSDSEVIKG